MKNICKQCSTEYERKASKIGIYCNSKCYGESKKGLKPWNKGTKGVVVGYWTGKVRPFMHGNTFNLKRKRTQAEKDSISKKLKGINRGGVTHFISIIRGCCEYKKWRKSIFERDNYTCQECNKSGVYLNADHILPFSSIIKKNNISSLSEAYKCKDLWNLSNGRTLCLDCHKETPTFGIGALKVSV